MPSIYEAGAVNQSLQRRTLEKPTAGVIGWQDKTVATYESIQPVLDDWAQAHGLHLFTEYQGEEVRATHIVDDKGGIYECGSHHQTRQAR